MYMNIDMTHPLHSQLHLSIDYSHPSRECMHDTLFKTSSLSLLTSHRPEWNPNPPSSKNIHPRNSAPSKASWCSVPCRTSSRRRRSGRRTARPCWGCRRGFIGGWCGIWMWSTGSVFRSVGTLSSLVIGIVEIRSSVLLLPPCIVFYSLFWNTLSDLLVLRYYFSDSLTYLLP